jgi:hypothetical protein
MTTTKSAATAEVPQRTWEELLEAYHRPMSFPDEVFTTAPAILDDALYNTAIADLDMAYRDARVEIHGDFERAHGRVLKGKLTPCWERPEWAGLGTHTQPAVVEGPRHRRAGISRRLLERVRDGLTALPAPEGPQCTECYGTFATTEETIPANHWPCDGSEPPSPADAEPLPRRESGIAWGAVAPGYIFEPGATTVAVTLPSAVAANEDPPSDLGELDSDGEKHWAEFNRVHDEEDAPDFPAEPERRDDGQEHEPALDEAAHPLLPGVWASPDDELPEGGVGGVCGE